MDDAPAQDATAVTPIILFVADEAAMRTLGADIARLCLPLPPGGFVIDLRGDLGMGKTVFARGAGTGLGVPPDVAIVSPTFTIARSYTAPGPDGVTRTLHHVDAYRLGGLEDLEAAGFEEMCEDEALTCVEWGDRVADALPEDRLEIRLEMDPRDAESLDSLEPGAIPVFPRRATLIAHGPFAAGVLSRLGDERGIDA